MENKLCPKCKQAKPLSDFGRDKRAKSGKAVYCRPCNRVKSQKQRDRDPNLNKRNHLRYRYGLTLEEVADMMLDQGNACAVCGTENGRLVIDHNHDTGKIRGLLCDSCNCAIGFVKEDPKIIKSLLKYLKKNEQ